MYLGNKRSILTLLFCFTFLLFKAQTLYWVGGSGNFNDGNHWSLSSGGSAANKIPSTLNDLVFDDNSTQNFTNLVVTVVGVNNCRSLKFTNDFVNYTVVGSKFTEINISGDFELNYKTDFKTNSKLVFKSGSSNYNNVRFNAVPYEGDVVFENGNWNLKNINIANANSLNFNSGNYKIISSSIKTGDFFANKNHVNFEVTRSNLDVNNHIEIGSNADFVSDKFLIKANQSNQSKFKIAPQANLGNDYKIINSNNSAIMACGATLTAIGISCSGSCDGQLILNIDASCTPGPYILQWNNPSCVTPTLVSVPTAGTYTISGLCSCVDFFDVIVFSGAIPIAFSNAAQVVGVSAINFVPINPLTVQPKCFGDCNGSITSNINGSVPPYTVTVNGGPGIPVVSGLSTFTNLCAGVNTFVVVDTKGCIRTFTNNLTQPLALSSTSITSSVTCNSSSNGSFTLSPINGTPGYTVTFTPGGSFTVPAAGSATLGGLSPGIVTFTVIDTKSCSINSSFNITQPPPLTVIKTQTTITCGGLCTGAASVAVSGGTGPYSYTWAPQVGALAGITNLCAGTHTVTIKDAQNCTITPQTFTLTSPPPITITPTFTNVSCNGLTNGSASVSVTGGTPGYVTTWIAAGPSTIAANSATVNNLGPGSYTVSVTDAVGCSTTAIVNIIQPPALSITATSQSITCFGLCNGGATVTPSGGNGAPFSFTWTPGGQNAASINTLCVGSYTIAVRDASNCPTSTVVTITQPSSVTANITTGSVSCFGGNTGTINATPTPLASGPFTFTLTSSTATVVAAPPYINLPAGNYTLTIGYGAGCTQTFAIIIAQPPSALVPSIVSTSLTCFNNCIGTLNGSAVGGTPAYTFLWTTPTGTLTGAAQVNLCAGNYTLQVTDANNCIATQTTNLASPPDITITITPTNVSCFGGTNGILSANVLGGTPGYTLTWSNGPIGNPNTNLSAGVYTLTVLDAIGCTKTQTATITSPQQFTVTQNTTSASCIGNCDGSVTVTVLGGNPPYNFQFNTLPVTTNTTGIISGLCVGSYTASITDASLCVTSTVITISQPASLTAVFSTASLSCNGVPTGSIGVVLGGQPGPYTFTLTSSTSTVIAPPSYVNLSAGVYTLTVGYGAGCRQSFTVNIAQPNPLVPSISSTSITCFNVCNGTLAGSALGGTPLYSFVWTTPTGTVAGGALAGQCVGNYTFTVTDANGCVGTLTTSLLQPTDMTVTINTTSVSCFSSCNGVLSGVVSGGTPGYTLNWSNGPTGNPNVGLCVGNYTLIVTDNQGCTKSATASVTSPSSITLTQNTTSTSCAASCNGSATITAVGGIGPYNYQFNTFPIINNATGIISGLCAGNYIASVTDANGCSQSINFTIVSPIALSAAITGLQSSCNACIGASTVTASNGTPGYTFVWTNSLAATVGTNAAVSSLCPGNYTVVVTDSQGCTATATAGVAQTVSVTVVTAGAGIQCFGACTGSATANALGGTLPYTYTWSATTPSQTSQTATNLCAGTYTVLVQDQLGCSNTGTITFTNPPDIIIAPTQTNVNCFGNCNGAINSNASGGTGLLTYSWSPGSITTTNLSNLCVGTYTLKVTDANGCSKTQIFNITSTPSISATFTTTNPSACIVNNGSICVTPSGGPSGGAGPYTFAWSPAGGVGGTTSCYSSLLAGPYTVTITDGACSTTVAAVLTTPAGPTLTINNQSVTCFGSSTGGATVTASGVGPFTFTWTPVVGFTTIGNTSTASGLNTGTYNISVTDGNGCVTSQSIGITQPTASLTINSTVTPVRCFGSANGSITVVPAGGTPGYTYNWLPLAPPITGQGTSTVTNLSIGNYTLNITDANLCPRQFTFVITQPTALTLTTTASNVLCNAACNGSINVAGGGGTAPITFTWLPVVTFTGSTNANIFNLCSASYTVNASDLNGCPISTVVTITQPIALTTTLTSVNASCSNSCNATASLNVAGGTPTYSFSWSNGPATTSTLGNLCAGNYTGTVIDGNGCVSATGFTITALSAFNVTLTPTSPLCNGASTGSISTLLSGNQGTVSFNWVASGVGQNPTNLNAGTYTLTAIDAAGCIASGVANLVNPPALLANVTTTNPACNGNCNGIAISTPVNAVGTVNYTWNPVAPNSPTVNALCAGNYTLTISDNNGCTDVQTFTLTNPPVLNVNTSIGPATCGSSNGSITAIPVGGTPAYTFSWTAPISSTNAAVSGLVAGVYTVIVTDANNCTNTVSIPLSNSNGPSAAPITSSSISCNAQCTGAASINPVGIVGGTPGYTVSWIVPPSASTVNPQVNLCAGTYSAQITDANNCILFNSVVIAQPAAISVLPNLTFPNCNGVCNGSVTLNTSGGTGPYNYSWSPGASLNATLTNACAGNYSITITDFNLCPSTVTLNLPGVQNMTATSTVTNNLCFGNCLGTASVTSIVGSPNFPITYLWSNAQTGPSAINLCNGVYTYTATDALGCFNSFTTNIISPSQITSTNSVASPSCNLCNGSSTITALGGTGPYTYSWTSSSVGPTATNLCAGLYQVLVTDNNLCTQLQNVIISSSSGIAGETTTIQNEICAGQCNGAATVVAVGGTNPISYSWIAPVVSNSIITNLCPGTYFLQMTDAQGCIRTSSVNINAGIQYTITPIISAPSCGASNGTINVVVSPTLAPGGYFYSWAPGPGITSSLTNIGAGNYSVTVTNTAGASCPQTQAFSINNTNSPVITFTQSNISCSGALTGSITALGTSTSTPVSYAWSNGGTLPTVSGLGPGVITLTVTAANGCKSIQSFTLTQNQPLQLSLSNVTQPRCHNDCNGAITLVPSGGTLPYTFTWSPSGTSNPQFSLCPGPSTAAIVYSATVIDANGCSITTSTTLINPASIVLTPTIANSSCSSIPDGSLSVGVIGGTPAYTYTWTGPSSFTASTQNINSIVAGTYSLSLTDNNGCRKDTSLIVVPTISVVALAGNDLTVCPTPSVTLTGTNSFGAVSFDWYLFPNVTNSVSNNSTYFAPTPPTAPGSFTYVLIATSSVSGCSDTDFVVVNTFGLPFVDAGPTFTIPVFTGITIGGSPTASGSVSITWSPSFTLDDPSLQNPVASNTVNTVYTVTIVDLVTGCTNSDTMTVFLFPTIKIPNGFSPNGDTKNELWIIDNLDQFPDNTVEIYNRWGEQLYFYNNYNGQFDGKYKGKDLPVGTYYYVINLNHPAYKTPFIGPLTIFR
jgi:gliding motility-associated-like protein